MSNVTLCDGCNEPINPYVKYQEEPILELRRAEGTPVTVHTGKIRPVASWPKHFHSRVCLGKWLSKEQKE